MAPLSPQSALDPGWLASQLEESLAAFNRFFATVPADRLTTPPPAWPGFAPLGEWTAHRHLFHLVHYERHYALPALRAAVDGEPAAEARPGEDQAYRSDLPAADLLRELAALRREQADLVRRADEAALARPVQPWGQSTLWSVAKTIQHTAEHVHAVGTIALFWDFYAQRLAASVDRPFAAGARRWLGVLQAAIRAADGARLGELFADEVVASGPEVAPISGREALAREQWRKLWPWTDDFTFTIKEMHCVGGDHGLCVTVPWRATEIQRDGISRGRQGLATFFLMPRQDDRWLAMTVHQSPGPADR